MSRDQVLTDAQWAVIAPLLPSTKGKRSRPFRDHRQVIEGIVFRYRTGCPWRDVPERFGPWKTLWKRHARFSKDGTWPDFRRSEAHDGASPSVCAGHGLAGLQNGGFL